MSASAVAPDKRLVVLDLTAEQVAQILDARGTSYLERLHATLDGSAENPSGGKLHPDTRLSMSLLHGLSVLAMFDGEEERSLSAIVAHIDRPKTTAERYVRTLVAAGLLEQDPTNRSYRLARLLRDWMLLSRVTAA